MKSQLSNQKGLALITTLIMMVLALGIVAILIQLTTRTTKVTGLQQGHTAALSTAKAGATVFGNTVLNCNSTTHICPPPGFVTNVNATCLDWKLYNNTTAYSTYPNAGTCGANATTSDATVNPDITWTSAPYTVYVKVIDTYMSPGDSNDTGCPTSTGCTYYTVVSTAISTTGAKAITKFIYRMTP